MPSFTSGCPSFAVLLAIRIVQDSASSQPPPRSNPLIAQMDGFPIVSSRWKTLCPKSENSFPLTGVCNASSLISAPATNAFSPAPVRINTRKAWSSRASSKAPCNSSTVLRFSAFSTLGRLKVMYAIPSLFSYKIFSYPISSPSRLCVPRRTLRLWVIFFLFLLRLKLQRLRIPRLGIIIKSPSRLPPVPSRQHHALEQRRRGKSPLLEFLKHDLRYVKRRIQPHEIQQCQPAHRMPATQLHGIVDVLDGADALFQRPYRIQKIRHQQPVHNKTWAVIRAHRRFTQLHANRHHFFVHGYVRRNRSHYLDQFHHRHTIEEVQPYQPLHPLRTRGNVPDRQRRHVACKNRRRRTNRIHRA